MATNNKIKFPFWVTPKTMETVKEMYKDDDCRSQSEFIEKAIPKETVRFPAFQLGVLAERGR